jgi:hypothetical protein
MELDIRCEGNPGNPGEAILTVNGIEVDRVPTLYYYLKRKSDTSCIPCTSHIYRNDYEIILSIFEKIQTWNGAPKTEDDIHWFRMSLLRILSLVPNPPKGLKEKWWEGNPKDIFEDLRMLSLHWHFVDVPSVIFGMTLSGCTKLTKKSKRFESLAKTMQSILDIYGGYHMDVWQQTLLRMRQHATRKFQKRLKKASS